MATSEPTWMRRLAQSLALQYARGYASTSASSVAIGTGAKSFLIEGGKAWLPGDRVRIASAAAPTVDYMVGTVDSYDGDTKPAQTTALAVTVDTGDAHGSGTHTDWTIALSGEQGAQGELGQAGIVFAFDSSTTISADPGDGEFRLNNASPASVTGAALDDLDGAGSNVATYLLAQDDSTSTIRGYILIHGRDSAFEALYAITGASTDSAGWVQFVLTYVTHVGSLVVGEEYEFEFFRTGDKGDTGATGPTGSTGATGAAGRAGLLYNFDSNTTTSSDPGTGDFRLNNASFASVTAMGISDTDADSGGNEAYLLAQDDSTTTGHRGYVMIRKRSAPSTFAIYDITGASTDSSGFVQFVLTHVVSSGSLTNADPCDVQFFRTGDKGTTGDTGATGSTGATGANGTDPGIRYTWSTGTGTGSDPGNGVALANSGTIGSVTTLAFDDLTLDSQNVEAYLLRQDDSTTTAHRGHVVIRQVSDATKVSIFEITGACTDSSGWVQFSVSNGAGTLPDNAATVSVQFYRTGDTGAAFASGTQVGQTGVYDGSAYFAAGPKAGTNLSDADSTVNPGGTGGGNFFYMPASTLSANRAKTIGTSASGLAAGDTVVFLIRAQPSTHTLTFTNGGTNGGNPKVVPAATFGQVTLRYDGTDWQLASYMVMN